MGLSEVSSPQEDARKGCKRDHGSDDACRNEDGPLTLWVAAVRGRGEPSKEGQTDEGYDDL